MGPRATAGLGGIVGIILAIIALKKIGRSGGTLRGRGLAIAGIIVSACTLLVWLPGQDSNLQPTG